MSTLPFTKYKNNERTVSGAVDVENSDVVLNVDTTLVAATIYLKSIPADYWSTLYKLYVKDINGNAAVNNITIIAPTGYLINNAQQIVIDVNGGGAVIRIQDNYDYNASLNYCCSPAPTITFLNTLGTTTDGNGNIITFPFTATSNGVYVLDMTINTTIGFNVPVYADTTTQLTINGAIQFSNINCNVRSWPASPITGSIELVHNHRAKVTLNVGDVAYFGAASSIPPPEITSGSMLIYKIA